MSRFAVGVMLVCCACSGPEPEHWLWVEDTQSLDNPFPDARLLTATGTELRPQFYTPFIMRKALTAKLKMFFDEYIPEARAHLQGLGNFSPTLLRASAPLDPATVNGHFARLRKSAGGWEVLERDMYAEHSNSTLDGTGVNVPDDFPDFILVRVQVPLREGEEGLLVALTGPKTKAGDALGRGREWDRSRDRVELGPVAAALGVPEGDILLALPLKAGPIAPDYQALKAWVDSPAGLGAVTIPPKAVTDRPVGLWRSTDSDWVTLSKWLERDGWSGPATHVGLVAFGELAARDIRENGAWRDDWVQNPSLAPVVPLHFVLSVPKGPKPAGGWPAIIGAHGVGGRNVPMNNDTDSFCLEFAELLASAGMACIGIDAPSHGLRGNIFGFFEVEHPRVMRENFREMTFDVLQLTRAIPTIDVDADGAPDFASQAGYFGNSLGSIMGASAAAVDDRIAYAALNVPGGGLSNILVSREIRDKLGLLIVAKTSITFNSPEYYGLFPIFRAMAQPFMEGGDPANVLALMPKSRAIFLQMGVGDITIPNHTTRTLETVGELDEPAMSVSGTAPLRVFYAVDPARFLPPDVANGYNGHNVIADIPFARTQIVDFLQSKGTTFTAP